MMFGFVVANLDKLSQEQRGYYRACYCGLCKALGKQHGAVCRTTLTYDMTFLILLLSSLDEEKIQLETIRCAVHPLQTHPSFTSRFTAYAADMNVILAYQQKMDDWRDDRKLTALSQARLIGRNAQRIRRNYPRQCAAINQALRDLSLMEKDGVTVPDVPANAFGHLLGEIFVYEDGASKEQELRAFGYTLGRFIYLMDATLDFRQDIRRERYNPLIAVPSSEHEGILQMLMAQVTACYELLQIRQNNEILENVLYSGVWTRLRAQQKKEAAAQ
jgi:hypothetical protein